MTLLASTVMSSAFANDMADCKYLKDVKLDYKGTIEKAEVVDRKISLDKLDGETVMKCSVTMNLVIDGKPRNALGSFIFDGDTPSNQACKRAETRAKEDALQKFTAQVLKGKQTMQCAKKDKPVVATSTPPVPSAKPVGKVETVTLEPINPVQTQPNVTLHNPNPNVRFQRPRRRTTIGMPVYTTDPRLRWSDVGPIAKCTRTPTQVWIKGYQTTTMREVCYE